MSKRKTTKEFIEQAIEIHDKKYDYTLVKYKTAKTKVKIICEKHGIYEQTPSNHTHKTHPQGCSKCYGTYLSNLDEFIDKSKLTHNNKYDYSKSIYLNSCTKLIIICPIHGEFEQSPNAHLNTTHGCIKCYHNIRRKNINDFKSDSNKIHNNKYDYSESIYLNSCTKLIIICPIHGKFKQTPNTHSGGKGCPKCYDNVNFIEKSLYILYDSIHDIYKIGYSKNTKKRIKNIEYVLQYKLETINIYEKCADKENDIHIKFTEKRVNHPIRHGGYTEWFTLNIIDIENIHNLIRNP